MNWTIRIRRLVCGWLTGHRPLHPTDRGTFLGGKVHDRWCARCGQLVRIPNAEDPYYDTWRTP